MARHDPSEPSSTLFPLIALLAHFGVAAAVLTAAVALIAVIQRREWSSRFASLALITPGIVFLAIGTAVIAALRVPDRADLGVGLGSVAVRPPVGGNPGRGFAAGLHVVTNACDETVEGWLAVNGTAEYWQDQARHLRGDAQVSVSLPDEDAEVLDVGLSRGIEDLAVPSFLPEADLRERVGYHTTSSRGQRIVHATVENWASHMSPLFVHFAARWIQDRSLGSCYLQLPAMSGSLTAEAAYSTLEQPRVMDAATEAEPFFVDDGRRLRVRNEWMLAAGTTTVETVGADLDSERSLPEPEDVLASYPTWICTASPLTHGRLGDLDKQEQVPDYVFPQAGHDATGAVSKGYIGAEVDDCGSTAVLVGRSPLEDRDLLLLLAGALLSLGATLLLEAALRGRRSGAVVQAPPAGAGPSALVAMTLGFLVGRRRR